MMQLCLQQLLAVFRTPKISKLTFEIGSEETKLMVTVLAENGEFSSFSGICSILPEPLQPAVMSGGRQALCEASCRSWKAVLDSTA